MWTEPLPAVPDERGRDRVPQPATFPWEVSSLRQILPAELASILGARSSTVVVPANVADKIATGHAADRAFLDRLGELLDGWELAGISPKADERIEVYTRLDGVWFTAVIKRDDEAGFNVLTTMHRLLERKLRGRERRGYLQRR